MKTHMRSSLSAVWHHASPEQIRKYFYGIPEHAFAILFLGSLLVVLLFAADYKIPQTSLESLSPIITR